MLRFRQVPPSQATWSTGIPTFGCQSISARNGEAEIDAKYPHTPSRCGSPELHNEAMRHAGITKCLIVGLRSNHLGLQIPNEYIADAVRHFQGTAIGLASVDPNSSNARDQVIHAATELQLRGLKLSPPYQAFHPHSPEAYRIYDAAADQGMFFMFHQGAVTHRRGVLEVAPAYPAR